MKILLADDDRDLLDVTAYALRREGFNVLAASDGTQALQRWETDQPDLVILDVGMPGTSGFEVCRRIRQDGATPIILLSGLTSDEHVVQGFRLGADDYVTKPFSPRQLAARVRALYRRSATLGTTEPTREVQVGDMLMDVDGHEVRRGNVACRLTPTEFRLLYILAINMGRVVTGARLVEYGWGYDTNDVLLVKTHICRIRQKLRLPRSRPGDIVSVPGVGYRLTAEPPTEMGQTLAPVAFEGDSANASSMHSLVA